MTDNSSNYHIPKDNFETNISLSEILCFLKVSWRKLILSSLIGAILSITGVWMFGAYKAEYILNNASTDNINSINSDLEGDNTKESASARVNANDYAIDLTTWKLLQGGLPGLASQILQEGKAPKGKEAIFKSLADDIWWRKNVTPNFLISKSDAKDLAGISKNLDLASTTILSINLSASGQNGNIALENVKSVAQFILNGGAYLQLRSYLNNLESDLIASQSELEKQAINTNLELLKLQQYSESLENLQKRYPSSSNSTIQMVSPTDATIKYFPINVQIISNNIEIYQARTKLQRIKGIQNQKVIIQKFLTKAVPVVETSFEGITLNDELLKISKNMIDTAEVNDLDTLVVLSKLQIQLMQIKARYTKGLVGNSAPSFKRDGVGLIRGFIIGFMVTLLATFFFLLAKFAWFNSNYQSNSGGKQILKI
jgi:hypothetical protein